MTFGFINRGLLPSPFHLTYTWIPSNALLATQRSRIKAHSLAHTGFNHNSSPFARRDLLALELKIAPPSSVPPLKCPAIQSNASMHIQTHTPLRVRCLPAQGLEVSHILLTYTPVPLLRSFEQYCLPLRFLGCPHTAPNLPLQTYHLALPLAAVSGWAAPAGYSEKIENYTKIRRSVGDRRPKRIL